MPLSRHSVPVRGVTLLLLLWVGLDLGAHGLFESDFRPIPSAGMSVGGRAAEDGAAGQTPDHCFCHSLSLGATVPLFAIGPERTGTLVSVVSCQAPASAARPLYHPPQVRA
jgi:hypothetical protein